MQTAMLYLLTVLIWGSTWFAIEFQLGDVAVEVSLVYRFGLAALLLWLWCLWRKLPMQMPIPMHLSVALMAVLNFALNYFLLYQAQLYLTSAMAAIAFSTMLLMNIVNTRLFFGQAIAKRIYAGALLGIAGIAVLFAPDLTELSLANTSLLGLLLVLSGTLSASFGNMLSVRNSRRGLAILPMNAWGMLYGSLALAALALLNGKTFTISSQPAYLWSLLYLSVFGSVIAFGSYFALLKRMGPEKASYVIVLFPLVAVVFSSLFEGFQWQLSTVTGFCLVLIGNALVLTPFDKLKQLWLRIKPAKRLPAAT
ncbi:MULTISPECIES: DMT family transporter [Alkalimonas]|uniref:EamA family transporter n=1 Tax=Alkalimonas mucilaginosa TaxID=3057676 RepID=A0ABU7JFL9_9GAMM|nr:EamA family transporter [Alkalimonas sp. MEB004]MEE2024153.1 EamA family transporter [Alkalimonas sp. MEB004]